MNLVVKSLLNETIRRAFESSPYYRQAFDGLDLAIDSISDLCRLPLLSRETFGARGHDLLAAGIVPATVGVTGGSTFVAGRSQPLLFYKSAKDVEASEQLVRDFRALSDPRPLLLHLVNMGHGMEPGGARDGCFQFPLERAHHFAAILRVLGEKFSFDGYEERISLLAGPLRLLKALTLLCMENDISGRAFAMRLVSSSSDQLTPRWRSIFAEYWGAAVDDVYGLSEVAGLHASRCDSCGHFHFSPLAVCEVLELDGSQQIARGIGRLVATALHPLSSLQPVIRYDTGDLIEVFDTCPTAATFGFEFLGRRSSCATVSRRGRERLALAPMTVNAVLDSIPDVAQHQHTFAKALGVRSPAGGPQWSMTWTVDDAQVTRIGVAVELCWSPRQFPAEALALRTEIARKIIAAAPTLKDLIAAGEADLQIETREPGTDG